ncbi:MAG: DUF5688 family protein [Eubacterium sp.]|nr:DUF5688 family protein [Eubacterium sp.]
MSKYDFLMQVKERLRQCHELSGTIVDGNVYVRNNDTECYGVSICRDEAKVSPVIYIDRFYDSYIRKKITLDETVCAIVDQFLALSDACKEHSDITLDFEENRDRITYRLISARNNTRYLETVPYIPFLDMAIIFTIVYRIDKEGLESIRITKELMENWDVSTGQLLKLARVNTPRIFPATLEPMKQVVKRFLQIDEEELPFLDIDSPVLLLSNKQNIYGATTILYRDEAEKIAEQLGESFFVIPSSIHEVLLMPESEVPDKEPLNEMIHRINQEHLGKVDVLSDCAYYYDRKEKRFYF